MSASGAPNGGKKTPLGAKTPQNAPNGVGKLPLGAGQEKMGEKDLESLPSLCYICTDRVLWL